MRIAITCANLVKDTDGVARVVNKTIEKLKEQKIEMIAFSPAPPLKQDQIIPVFKVPSIPIPFYKEYRFAMPSFAKIKKQLDEFKPDIIHIHSQDLLGVMAIMYARQNGIPVVTTYHTDYIFVIRFYKRYFLEKLAWQVIKFNYKNCHLIFCPSKFVVNTLKTRKITNTALLNHGVDTNVFNPQKASKKLREKLQADGKKLVLYAGRIVWEKGLKTLADAYKILEDRKDILFVIAGKGSAKKELQKLMPKARFIGHLDAKTLSEIYASSDIFVFPSLTETFGLAILEAMASGLPVIGADVGCNRELIENNFNGILFSPRSPHKLAKAIVNLATNDELRQNLSQKAAESGKQKPWDEIIKQLLVYYDLLVYHKDQLPIRKPVDSQDLDPW